MKEAAPPHDARTRHPQAGRAQAGRLRPLDYGEDARRFSATVSEYRYNGLGHRIGWRSDTNFDSTVDGSDPWYWFVYDDRWRVVATYRGSDAHPKERFIHHNAGVGGFGGSSYIDSVILRDSDDPEAWTGTADGTLETRHYHLQNWRHDVVALIEPDGTPFEYVRYSAYGVPTVYAAGDVNRDGVCDGYDPQDWDDYGDYGTGALAVDLDVNRDGVVDSADRALVQGHADWLLWASPGRGHLSRLHGRRGYAGYEFDPATAQWHARHRVLVSEMGRWNRRDPLGYVVHLNLYVMSGSQPVSRTDPEGLLDFSVGVLTAASSTGACMIGRQHGPAQQHCVQMLSLLPDTPSPYDTLSPRVRDFCRKYPAECLAIDWWRNQLIEEHLKKRWPGNWWKGHTDSVHNAVVHCALSCVLSNSTGTKDEKKLYETWLFIHNSPPEGRSCENYMDLDNNDIGWKIVVPARYDMQLKVKQCVDECVRLARSKKLSWLQTMSPDAKGNPDLLPEDPTNCPLDSLARNRNCCAAQ